MSLLILVVFFFILIAIELIYFKVADRYNIIDHPNHRSSHSQVTIRGGGIIFPIAILLGTFYFGFEYVYFSLGLLLIGIISFLDDIKPVARKLRITVHLIAVTMLFYQLALYNLSIYWVLLGLIFAIGTINAINFMDGVNGITGGYGLVTLITLYYINKYIIIYTDENYLVISMISILVFIFFNFRTKAKCFAGDIGSVSLAFIIVFFILQLILKTNNLIYLLLLLIYGLDTVTTILFRIIRRENITEAHRSHFYQFLANERKWPHLLVAALYVFSQGILNIIIINCGSTPLSTLMIVVTSLTCVFIIIRFAYEGRRKLLMPK